MKRWLVIVVVCLMLCPLAFALIIEPTKEITEKPTPEPVLTPDENTTVKIVYEGPQTITSALTAAAQEKSKAELTTYEKALVLAIETDKLLAVQKYPYQIEKTDITILKYRCAGEICGYWIEAFRTNEKGIREEVATNSPIWISPPPYQAFVSEFFDSAKNEQTITLKEDPRVAVEQILQGYVDRQPVGKPTTGTKE